MARWQPLSLTSLRTGCAMRRRASCSGKALRNGLSSLMPVISSDFGSMFAPSKGSTFTATVSVTTRRPKSSMRMMQLHLEQSILLGVDPPVSTSDDNG